MDSSMVDSVFDDGPISDAFSPEPVAVSCITHSGRHFLAPSNFFAQTSKPKPKATAKTAPKKAATAKAPPKKMAQTTLKSNAKPTASKKRPKPDSEDEQLSPEAILNPDGSILSMTPPSAKKQKKAPAPKKTGAKPLQENENESLNLDGANDTKPKKTSKSTDQYQKVSISVSSEYHCATLTSHLAHST